MSVMEMLRQRRPLSRKSQLYPCFHCYRLPNKPKRFILPLLDGFDGCGDEGVRAAHLPDFGDITAFVNTYLEDEYASNLLNFCRVDGIDTLQKMGLHYFWKNSRDGGRQAAWDSAPYRWPHFRRLVLVLRKINFDEQLLWTGKTCHKPVRVFSRLCGLDGIGPQGFGPPDDLCITDYR